jgi:hypothetical protein
VNLEDATGAFPEDADNDGVMESFTRSQIVADQAMILDVKGNVDPNKVIKRYDNIAKLIRKGNISDELGYTLEAEILKLKSIFMNMTTSPTNIEVTKPEVVKGDSTEIYNYLFNVLKK